MIGFLLCGPILAGLVCGSFAFGLVALKAARQATGTRAKTWRLLQITLWEPLLTMPVAALVAISSDKIDFSPTLAFVALTPMLLQLLPLIGKTFHDETDRDMCDVMVLYGIGRWLCAQGTMLALYKEGGLAPLTFLCGAGLWLSYLRWSSRQLLQLAGLPERALAEES